MRRCLFLSVLMLVTVGVSAKPPALDCQSKINAELPKPGDPAFITARRELVACFLQTRVSNTRGVKLTRAEIPKLVIEKTARDDGFYWMSIWLEPGRDDTVTVGVDAWIATNEVEAPMGLRLHSNGTLERSVLTAVARALGQ